MSDMFFYQPEIIGAIVVLIILIVMAMAWLFDVIDQGKYDDRAKQDAEFLIESANQELAQRKRVRAISTEVTNVNRTDVH